MTSTKISKKIAIVGGGPAGLFIYKKIIETAREKVVIDIFESRDQLGMGMPYSCAGAANEHITNVSGNEIPVLVTTVVEWIATLSTNTLAEFNLDKDTFHEYMTLPRLLFGRYLNAQFLLLQEQAARSGFTTTVHLNTMVTDIIDLAKTGTVIIEVNHNTKVMYDQVVISCGHNWPVTHEGKVTGYFDSPYPPVKLKLKLDHTIAIRGSSLTAIDAIRTLARANGTFVQESTHKLSYHANADAPDFRMIMHSRNGLLPAVRFHLADSHLENKSLLTKEEIDQHIVDNGGFLSLDFIFEKDFKWPFRAKDHDFFKLIESMKMEEFVERMMSMREDMDPFTLLKAEYAEADTSMQRKQSVYWKEMLGVLSFAMNYPAKYLSAEDMLRLQKILMPLISVVIAYVPQSSCEEMMALHDAGRLKLISVGEESKVMVDEDKGIIYQHTDEAGTIHTTAYQTFIDCIGQPHLSLDSFPFPSLVKDKSVIPARLKFRAEKNAENLLAGGNKSIEKDGDDQHYLKVPGIAITDNFNIIGSDGRANPHIHIMAVPYIGGYNPDYSGLDFCEAAARLIAADIFPG